MWVAVGGLVAYAAVLIALEQILDTRLNTWLVLSGIAVFVAVSGYATWKITRATAEICRFNGLASSFGRRLSKRQLFDTAAFDTWLAAAPRGPAEAQTP